jgi:biotin carboxyl carrier protein
MRRRAGRLLAVALVPLALAAGCGQGRGGDDEAAPAPVVPVRVEHVADRLFQPTVSATGQWTSSNDLVVAAPFPAVVDSVGVHPGDRVQRGKVLAWLTTRESAAAVEGAELLLRQAPDSTGRAEARRALGLARRDLVRVPLTAATTGTVVRRSVEPGAVVENGTEILALVPDRALVFEAHIPLPAAGAVRVGQPARVVSEGGAVLASRVQRFLPRASAADQTALAWLSPVDRPPAGLLGRFGTASIETGPPRRARAVPDSALVEDDLTGQIRLARVDSAGVAVWTGVRLGIHEDGWRELLTPPLPPGTAVVVSGQRGLPDSTRVSPRR